MNTQMITDRVADIVALLNTANGEAKEIESKRVALEKSSTVHTEREKRLNDIALAQAQKQKDLDGQKEYVDNALRKLEVEKVRLANLSEEKRELEKQRSQLEVDKKEPEGFAVEKQKFEAERAEFAREKALLVKEKLAIAEQQRLLVVREQNIKQKEERIDKIERMTQV